MLIVIPFAYNPRQCKLAYYEKNEVNGISWERMLHREGIQQVPS